MSRIRALTRKPPNQAVSIDGVQEFISTLRMILALLMEANEVLGIPIPDKGGG